MNVKITTQLFRGGAETEIKVCPAVNSFADFQCFPVSFL